MTTPENDAAPGQGNQGHASGEASTAKVNSTVYGTAAPLYWQLGWRGPLPLPPAKKWPPPDGFTGHDGVDPSYADVTSWTEDRPAHNVALRLPADVVGIDVDSYADKRGGETLAEAEKRWGTLPDTVISTSRDDGVSGIRLYRVPDGYVIRRSVIRFGDLGDIEIVRRGHRYATVAPSVHPSGAQYRWIDGSTWTEVGMPAPGELAMLPAAWAEALAEGAEPTPAGDPSTVQITGGEPSHTVAARLEQAVGDLQGGAGSRFDSTRDHALALVRLAEQGEPGVAAALDSLRAAYVGRVGADRDGGITTARAEFDRFVVGGRSVVAGSPSTSVTEVDSLDEICAGAGRLEDDEASAFWDSRESLATIRDYALSAMVSPWGLLGAVIAYALAEVPYWCELPGIADDESGGSLNLFVGLVARSGGTKGRIVRIARRYVGRSDIDIPPGSGEGLAKMFVRRRTPKDDEAPESIADDAFTVGRDRLVFVRRSLVLNVPEVDTLESLGRRSSSTLPSMLRQAFSGETLGFGYADDSKRLFVPDGQYRMTMLVGVQPERSGALFDDSDGGTPQRFVWMPAEDRTVRRIGRPARPDVLDRAVFGGTWPYRFEIPETAREAIEIAAEQRAQGLGDRLDAHRLFAREKVAAALAILDGRRNMSEEDWQLSATVETISDRGRRLCLTALRNAADAENVRRGEAEGARADVADTTRHDRKVKRVAGVLVRAVAKHGPTVRGKLQSYLRSTDRDVADDAVAFALEAEYLVEVDGVVKCS